MNKEPVFTYPVFALGFRVFFALAALAALALIAAWVSMIDDSLKLPNYYPGNYWHAHEMLAGYASAVIAGFLLTAVRNWTGIATPQGDKLALLSLLWLYGRIAPFFIDDFSPYLIAFIDWIFLPVLAWFILKPIVQSRQFKQLIFIALLALMAVGNALIHLQILGIAEAAILGISLVFDTIMLMILVMAGRVFPFFTERGLTGVLIIRNPVFDVLALITAAVVFTLQALQIDGLFLAIAAAAAFVANSARLANWYVHRIWYVPLLWVLYIGYMWIILGFGLTALAAYKILSSSLALHAFTVGGIGVLTLGMMARVALGHTGRPLRVSNAIALGFVLINVSALLRTLLPLVFPNWYSQLIYVSSLSWLAAFSLFILIYSPILTSPRIDGKEG